MSEPRSVSAGENSEIMTIEEVATFLRLKPQTIYKWAQEKRIPAAKLGKEWRFRRSLIELWLDEKMLGEDSGFAHLRGKRSSSPS